MSKPISVTVALDEHALAALRASGILGGQVRARPAVVRDALQRLFAALASGAVEMELQALSAAASLPFRASGLEGEELQAGRRVHVRRHYAEHVADLQGCAQTDAAVASLDDHRRRTGANPWSWG